MRYFVLMLVMYIAGCAASKDDTVAFSTFSHNGNTLHAYYQKPKNTPVKGVVLFVHGDGALPYDAHGYYPPIWKQFLKSGYAVFSWDKPGVGKSSGNWLHQSMQDRQGEVQQAIDFVKQKYVNKTGKIGLIGFSQAGWVVPAVAQQNPDVDFIVGVGFAINWLEQSWYLTKTRMTTESASDLDLKDAEKKYAEEKIFWQQNPVYTDYIQRFDNAIGNERFEFVRKNVLSDARFDFEDIKQPVLILLGEMDRNVDVKNTYHTLEDIFKHKTNLDMGVVPRATHSLLKYPEFDTQNPDLTWLLKLHIKGEKAYAPEFFDKLGEWLAYIYP